MYTLYSLRRQSGKHLATISVLHKSESNHQQQKCVLSTLWFRQIITSRSFAEIEENAVSREN